MGEFAKVTYILQMLHMYCKRQVCELKCCGQLHYHRNVILKALATKARLPRKRHPLQGATKKDDRKERVASTI